MSCAYCLTNQFHLLVIQKADGTFHVHAPFQDKKIMKRIKSEIEKTEKTWKPKERK